MTQYVIEQLSKVENPIAEKLIAINKNTQSEVSADYYTTTVFETYEKYATNVDLFNMKMVGSTVKKLVDTSLAFTRGGNVPSTWRSCKDQGVAFGATLIDYISKKPLIIFVVDKDGTKYKYSSIVFDYTTKTYITGETKSTSCSNPKELVDFAMVSLNLDIDKYFQKINN